MLLDHVVELFAEIDDVVSHRCHVDGIEINMDGILLMWTSHKSVKISTGDGEERFDTSDFIGIEPRHDQLQRLIVSALRIHDRSESLGQELLHLQGAEEEQEG